jgi:hypothetical protein
MGPLMKLFLVQARGSPFQLVAWAIADFIMLYGSRDFSKHWLFYQDLMEVFNESNSAGNITSDHRYRGVLIFAICSGVAIAFKRFCIGLGFGKNSYHRYAEKLSDVLKQVLLVAKVTRSAQDRDLDFPMERISGLEEWRQPGMSVRDVPENDLQTAAKSNQDDDDDALLKQRSTLLHEGRTKKNLTESQNFQLAQLLGDWEEIEIADAQVEEPSLSAIVQFRASVSVLDSDIPFSQAFGIARTRVQAIDGAQRLYTKLLKKQQMVQTKDEAEAEADPRLQFHTIALTALGSDGKMDQGTIKDLVAIFRPTREGDMTLLDFCKSIDSLYKELRKLRASIANEGRMNAGSEKILNVVFYFILLMIGLSVVGVDPVALFGVLASSILGFSFMISGASSDYFRGLLFILVQRPYDIGDRIAVAGPQDDASGTGSSGWIVKDVTL